MSDILLEDYSSTYEALSIIYGTMESESEAFKAYVTTGYLMESGAPKDIIMESVGDMISTIVNAIKKFIEKVKAFFRKIMLYITSAFQDLDKVADEVKKVINDKDIKFTIDGYDFTVIDKDGPDITEFQNIVSKYNDDIDKISDLKEKEIKAELVEWLDEDHLSKLRGEVLRTHNSIQEDDFLKSVRKHYRNGKESTKDIRVDKAYVNDIISHAKKLEHVKKSSIDDRDKLLSLLSKTESFFSRTVQTYYKGNKKIVNANKIDIDNNKFSKSDNEIDVSESNLAKVISTYSTIKYKQVNVIASMINLVACEKVNALKDQIKQERTILRKCLFGVTRESDKEDELAESKSIITSGKDYSLFAMESDLSTYRLYEEASRRYLLEETEFILKSIEDGEVYKILEADTDKLGGKVKQAISDIIEMVISSFRKKAMGTDEFNKAWIAEITAKENKLEEKAKAKQEFTMANFFDVDKGARTRMVNNLTSAINTAYGSKNYDDVSWATSILPSITTADKLRDTDTRTQILNFYRTGKGDLKLETKKMNGAELAGKLKVITDYVLNYGDSVTKPVEKLSEGFKNASNSFKVTESFTPDTFLSILGCTVQESDIILCNDYNSIFEADDAVKIGKGTEGANSGEHQAAMKDAQNAAKAETQNGKDTAQSATKVQSEDDPKASEELKKQTPEGQNNQAATNYKRMIDNFFKHCITLFLKAREEQYIAFVNALSDIDGQRPKKDKNGKYIPKAKVKEEEKAKAEEAVKTQSK